MKHNFSQRSKTLEKLFQANFDTEQKILAIKLEDLDKIKNLQSGEILLIIELKKAIKNKKVITFLSGFNEKKGTDNNE